MSFHYVTLKMKTAAAESAGVNIVAAYQDLPVSLICEICSSAESDVDIISKMVNNFGWI